MAIHTVDVFAFFVNGANRNANITRVKQDIVKANLVWKGCIRFILKSIYFSQNHLVVDASSIPADNVFKNNQIDSLVKHARKVTGKQVGIYVFYIGGNYLAEGRGKRVVGVGGTEIVHFHNPSNYELFGRVLLTDMASGRHTLAHEFGHILLKRYSRTENRFIHDDPSGPYIHTKKNIVDPAHNQNPQNLMFPISPDVNPFVTSDQCKIAKQSKIAKIQNIRSDHDSNANPIHFF